MSMSRLNTHQRMNIKDGDILENGVGNLFEVLSAHFYGGELHYELKILSPNVHIPLYWKNDPSMSKVNSIIVSEESIILNMKKVSKQEKPQIKIKNPTYRMEL